MPAAQLAQAPEQAAVVRPAFPPQVPAGQREQACAPALIEYVPGLQGVQGSTPEKEKKPGTHCGRLEAVAEADEVAVGVAESVAWAEAEVVADAKAVEVVEAFAEAVGEADVDGVIAK